jgi:threonine/homoserine efflux transporter RhtA
MAYSWYNRSMKILPATLTGSMLSLEVAYGTFAGWMLGDALTLGETLATLLIANLLLWDLWQVLQRLKTKYLG